MKDGSQRVAKHQTSPLAAVVDRALKSWTLHQMASAATYSLLPSLLYFTLVLAIGLHVSQLSLRQFRQTTWMNTEQYQYVLVKLGDTQRHWRSASQK